jgi:3-oxoacyl-[acyl-carrier protein] reductase
LNPRRPKRTPMNTTLDDRVALVTGAGQGIGRAIAQALAGRGATVAVNDVDRDRVERVAAELQAAGGRAAAAVADVSSRQAVEAMVEGIVAQFGRLDILVNNARVEPPRPDALSRDQWWERVLAVDLKGAYLCAMAAWPIMERRQFGRVINISSVQAVLGKADDDWIAYSCAKAGLLGLTRSLSRRGMRQGITANAVAPDYVETEVMQARWGQDRLDELAASVPLGRAGRPEEVADAVLYLVQAGFTTGETIHVNGGRFVLP